MNHFPKLHEDLQKFAVAFEELVEDETNPKIYNALQTTQIAIKSLLCEVEITIMDLPYLRIPSRVERSIMSNVEREPVDETRRLVRDWGILLKYRDYLHAWKRIFDYWPAPEETFDNIIRYSNPIGKNIEYYVCDDTVLRKIIRWLQQNWSRNIRYLSSAINEEKPNRVTIYAWLDTNEYNCDNRN